MKDADIIVVGAGITGLTIARQLLRAGRKVLILEGRERLGGRIHTIVSDGTSIETGAEFIHGDLQTTLDMIREYNIGHRPIGGEYWRYQDGKIQEEDDQVEHRKLLIQYLNGLQTDMTVDAFLDQYFPDEQYIDFKHGLRKYVEGYDSADSARASAFALRDELQEDQDDQYRIDGGYTSLIEAIASECIQRGGSIQLSQIVKELKWSAGQVQIQTADKKTYKASQCILAVPLGVLGNEDSEASITFKPEIKSQIEAVRAMGFGNVIKVVLDLKEPFWTMPSVKKHLDHNLSKLGFLFSDAPIPTWWTQYPDKSNLLTGWLAGPAALALKHADEASLLEMAINSLAYIFNMSKAEVEDQILSSHIINWTADPFTLGAYAYKTIHTKDSIAILSSPVENTIFFAGEALYEGVEMGTVEAALKNALEVAEKILV